MTPATIRGLPGNLNSVTSSEVIGALTDVPGGFTLSGAPDGSSVMLAGVNATSDDDYAGVVGIYAGNGAGNGGGGVSMAAGGDLDGDGGGVNVSGGAGAYGGGRVNIQAGEGLSGPGGNLYLLAGEGIGSEGGDCYITAGDTTGVADDDVAGSVLIQAGNASHHTYGTDVSGAASGGYVGIYAGSIYGSGATGVGGYVDIMAGAGGGNVNIVAGISTGVQPDGDVLVTGGVVTLQAFDDAYPGPYGAIVEVTGGDAAMTGGQNVYGGNGGLATVSGGPAPGGGDGGNLHLIGGQAPNGTPGNVNIVGGLGDDDMVSAPGSITVQGGVTYGPQGDVDIVGGTVSLGDGWHDLTVGSSGLIYAAPLMGVVNLLAGDDFCGDYGAALTLGTPDDYMCVAGSVALVGGAGMDYYASGGNVNITGGATSASGPTSYYDDDYYGYTEFTGGKVNLTGGAATSSGGVGGGVTIQGGATPNGGYAGDVTITGGHSDAPYMGSVYIEGSQVSLNAPAQPGVTGSEDPGNITLQTGMAGGNDDYSPSIILAVGGNTLQNNATLSLQTPGSNAYQGFGPEVITLWGGQFANYSDDEMLPAPIGIHGADPDNGGPAGGVNVVGGRGYGTYSNPTGGHGGRATLQGGPGTGGGGTALVQGGDDWIYNAYSDSNIGGSGYAGGACVEGGSSLTGHGGQAALQGGYVTTGNLIPASIVANGVSPSQIGALTIQSGRSYDDDLFGEIDVYAGKLAIVVLVSDSDDSGPTLTMQGPTDSVLDSVYLSGGFVDDDTVSPVGVVSVRGTQVLYGTGGIVSIQGGSIGSPYEMGYGQGGQLNLYGGQAPDYNGQGGVYIKSPDYVDGEVFGAHVYVEGSTSEYGGGLDLRSGDGEPGSTQGGYVALTAGDGTIGGPVNIFSGSGSDGHGGDITISPGTGAGSGSRDGLIFVQNLPTTDPHAAGALWLSGTALHVSTG